MFDKAKLIKHWSDHAQYDIETAKAMLKANRYPYALFMCHLAIEKLLKAIVVSRTNEHAPYTHNLVVLSDASGLSFTEEQKKLIGTLNEFNIEARYPDWQENFYSIATPEYVQSYLSQTKELFIWLDNSLHK